MNKLIPNKSLSLIIIRFLFLFIMLIGTEIFAQAETEPNGTVSQSGTQTVSAQGTITGDVCLGGGCPAADPTDFWNISDGSSGTFIATWGDNVQVTLFTYTTSDRNTAPSSLVLTSGVQQTLSASSFYSISVQFVSISVFTSYSVALSGTSLPSASAQTIDFESEPFVEGADFGSAIYTSGNIRLTYSSGNFFEDTDNGFGNSNGLSMLNFTANETLTIETIDGTEVDFQSFFLTNFFGNNASIQGFRDGGSTGTQTIGFPAAGLSGVVTLTNSIFDNVDRAVVTFAGGAFDVVDQFVFVAATPTNTPPTASSFTAANGPFENLTYTFSTSDFGYFDTDGDLLTNLLIEVIPTTGTLYVDADGGDDFDTGEQLTNGGTVSLADLNAGNLQYIQNGSTNTSFQFEVNDGTDNSTGNYVSTLNVTPIPTVTLSVSPTSRFESITTPANITATLSNTYGANVTVNLAFSGTATGGGLDYTLGSSAITINAGATSNSTTITNVNDAIFEGNESVVIDITSVTNGTENGTQQVTYTISDDETPPNVVFELLSIYDPTSENGGVAYVSAELDASSGVTTTVPLSFSGTATQGDDYNVSSSFIVIAAGDVKDSIAITGINDTLFEGDESIVIDMGSPTNATELGVQQVSLTLSDDDLNTAASVNDPSVTEGDAGTTTLQFTVSLDAPAPAGGATIDYATSDGSATAGSDYTGIGTTTLSFLAGETSKTVDVTITGDDEVERNETLTLTLSNPTGTNVLIADATGTGTINNDDQATVTIADVSVNENNGTATITVIADNAVDGGFDVDVSTADGTATTADSDYTAVTSQTLTFAGAASESETFNITIGGDTKVEADETVSISMSGLSPAMVASGDIDITDGATLIINNDDQATVTIANVSGNEDDGAITVTVMVDNAVDGGFDVDLSTVDGTATTADSDYSAVTAQTLTFTGTASETETFTVTPTADATPEPDETVIIGMSGLSPSTVASGDIDITDGATLTILNDDDISISVNDPSVTEGDAGTTTLQFTVSLDAPAPAGGATIDYATSDGSATAGSDYTGIVTSTLSFLAGESSKTVDVTVAGDETVEVDETLTLTLSNPTGTDVVISDATGTGTITNDDQATVTIADVSVNENNGTATITVIADNAVDGGFDVDVSTADGTATTADSDYTAVTSQTLTFAGTASESETFNITIGGDTKVEADETVSISMSGLSPATVASGDIDITDGATLIINNDDVATLSIAATAQAAEDATDGLFTITTSNPFSSAVTLNITVTGSATEGTDYATIGTSLVFPANQTMVTVPVDVTADNIIEGSETVILTLTGTNNLDAVIGATDNATITIVDDDLSSVTSVSVPTDGNYGIGQHLDFMVTFSDPITITGSPSIELTIGTTTVQAVLSGAVTNSITAPFRYTIVTGDLDTDGIMVGALVTNGGTITDAAGNNTDLTLNAVSSTTGVLVDAVAPMGYAVVIDQDPINESNENSVSFTFSGAEVGSVYEYAISSSEGGTTISGLGTISESGQTISGINLSGLNNGTILLNVTLTDGNGNMGDTATDTAIKGVDTDNDGIEDTTDTDDDNDGTEDTEDAFPLDDTEDTDTDGDGIGDNADTDDDGDGVNDNEDAFPLDDTEDNDTDGDGIGDNADTDDDNDGVDDTEDAFPLDDTEDTDTDGDGIGDNADDDDDNDGVNDSEDAFPLDDTEDTDTDGDGIGNNADTDDDNDGILDVNDSEPLVPNNSVSIAEAMTPNGDGINDNWIIEGIENYPNNTVRVYNRGGREIFSENGYQNTWDGSHNGSGRVPAGSYYYAIDLGEGSTPKTGWIFINY